MNFPAEYATIFTKNSHPLKGNEGIAKPLFVTFVGELMKHSGVEAVFSGGDDSAVSLGFLATQTLSLSLAEPENALYQNWMTHFGDASG